MIRMTVDHLPFLSKAFFTSACAFSCALSFARCSAFFLDSIHRRKVYSCSDLEYDASDSLTSAVLGAGKLAGLLLDDDDAAIIMKVVQTSAKEGGRTTTG